MLVRVAKDGAALRVRTGTSDGAIATLIVPIGVGLGLVAGLLGGQSALALAMLAALTWFGYANFPLVLWTFLVARTTLDLPLFADAFPGLGANTAQLTTVAVLAFGLLYLISRPERLVLDGVTKAYAVFLALLALTFFVSTDLSATLQDWSKVATYLLVFVVVRADAARSPAAYRRWSHAVLLSAVVPVVVAYVQLSGVDVPPALSTLVPPVQAQFGDLGRVSGTLPAINVLAMFLMMPMTLLVASAYARNSSSRWLASLAFVALFVLFVSTYTRAAWYGFGLSVLTFAALRARRLLFLAPVAAMVLFVIDPLLIERILDFDITTSYASTLGQRLVIWRQALDIFASNPLFGVGLGVGTWQAGEAAFNYRLSVHNDYLRVLVDAGIVGFSAYLAHLTVTTVALWRAARDVRLVLPAAALALWLGLLVTRATDNVLTNPPVQLYLWTVVALALGHAEAQRSVVHDIRTPKD